MPKERFVRPLDAAASETSLETAVSTHDGARDRFCRRTRLTPMLPRSAHEPHRTASSLELFFDLVFVISVQNTSEAYHAELVHGGHRGAVGLGKLVMIFFTIWWAWMNYTWFGTSFDTDDWLYRFLSLIQMVGALVHAASVRLAFQHDPDYRPLAIGYVVMRFAMVSQWLRASTRGGRAGRAAMVYAALITILQVLWVLWAYVFPDHVQVPLFVVFAFLEVCIPLLAETVGRTPWHAHHITERYGCFTLIQLGESLTGANKILAAFLQSEGEESRKQIGIFLFAFVIGAALWWIYFWAPHHHAIASFASSLQYGYIHFLVFMAIAALAAGIEAVAQKYTEPDTLPRLTHYEASFSVTVPVAVFLLGTWWILIRKNGNLFVNLLVPFSALVIQLDALIHLFPLILTTAFLIVIVLALIIVPPRCEEDAHEERARNP